MSHLATLLKQFADDESGAALVEYAVIFAVILAGTVGALGLVTTELGNVLGLIQTTLASISALVPGAP